MLGKYSTISHFFSVNKIRNNFRLFSMICEFLQSSEFVRELQQLYIGLGIWVHFRKAALISVSNIAVSKDQMLK